MSPRCGSVFGRSGAGSVSTGGRISVLLGLLASATFGFEAQGRLQRIDPEGHKLDMFANGSDHSVMVATDARIMDEAGAPLSGGLTSKALTNGAPITVTVDRGDLGPVVRMLRLGGRAPDAKSFAAGKPSVGLTPLCDLSAGVRYKGEDGGLYGGGRNEPPAAHAAAAKRQTDRIVPLGPGGQPASDGKIVLLSISMSNATMEFSLFKRMADADPQKSGAVTVVDGAQGGQAMAEWVDPASRPWTEVDRRLGQAGVSPQQVQAVWIKLANKRPTGELSEHVGKLKTDTAAVLRNAKARFPNLRIAYLGSRIYGGYAASDLNPEPYAYEGVFAVRGLILDQAGGDKALACEGADIKAPLLLWGPYLWADGTKARASDGLVWERADFAADGTHPSEVGRRKVAERLLAFFKEDPFASSWFNAKRP